VIGLVNSNGLERYKVTLLEFRVLLFGVACRSRRDRSHDSESPGLKPRYFASGIHRPKGRCFYPENLFGIARVKTRAYLSNLIGEAKAKACAYLSNLIR
jgi:hypothetical protein